MDRLEELIAEFEGLDFQERLELLLDFAGSLPPIPAHLAAQRDAGLNRVVECQTPVFLWVEPGADDQVRLFADVAPEAPTVKGFMSILVEAWDRSSADAILAAPSDVLKRIGLAEALGMTRLRGLNAIVARVKRSVVELQNRRAATAQAGAE